MSKDGPTGRLLQGAPPTPFSFSCGSNYLAVFALEILDLVFHIRQLTMEIIPLVSHFRQLTLKIINRVFHIRQLALDISHVLVELLQLELQSTRPILDEVIAIGLVLQGLLDALSYSPAPVTQCPDV